MADFKASYGEMESMAGKLEQGREDIADILRQLKQGVDTLLGDDFKTEHASGKFGEGYTELTTGLETAIDGIRDMGESLRKMQQAIKDTDAALAGQLVATVTAGEGVLRPPPTRPRRADPMQNPGEQDSPCPTCT